VVALAQRLFEVPIAAVSLIDEHREWFKARCGLDASETSRDESFNIHALDAGDLMVVEDATRDPGFSANSFVTGEAGIRFMSGAASSSSRRLLFRRARPRHPLHR
jgi:hypothetical protein